MSPFFKKKISHPAVQRLKHIQRKKKSIIFLSSRLRPRPPAAESQQHPTLHPEPEGDRQPAQAHTAVENDRMIGHQPATRQRL